jgi:formamidopyrimidine-DNA glycosylase
MPELPEVETIKNDLAQKVLGLSITGVTIYDARIIYGMPPERFRRYLRGQSITQISRRSKGLIWTLQPSMRFLIVQVMMTGQLIYATRVHKDRHTRVLFKLSNHHYLHYNDQRLFGRLLVVDDWRELSYFHQMGPEPLGDDFNERWLQEALARRSTAIKPLLMDHRLVAGIGNIYASEICYRCGILPQRPAKTLTQEEIGALCRSVKEVLGEAITHRGTSMRNYRDSNGAEGNFKDRIRIYGRDNQPCLRCHHLIERIVLNGRSTFYCRQCQG